MESTLYTKPFIYSNNTMCNTAESATDNNRQMSSNVSEFKIWKSVVHIVLYKCSQFVERRRRRRRRSSSAVCHNRHKVQIIIHVKLCHLIYKKHHIAQKLHMISKKQFCTSKLQKILWGSMPPNPSSCMTHYMNLTIPNLMAAALLCVVLETEMFTLNLFLQATMFLRSNFTTRTTNI